MQWLIDIIVKICKTYTDTQIAELKVYTDFEIAQLLHSTNIKFGIERAYTDALVAAQDHVPSGTIAPWYGERAYIPDGWQACNGTNGTPDLRNLFVRNCGSDVPLHSTGGSVTHTHSPGIDLALGKDINATASSLPPYHALWWMMKL